MWYSGQHGALSQRWHEFESRHLRGVEVLVGGYFVDSLGSTPSAGATPQSSFHHPSLYPLFIYKEWYPNWLRKRFAKSLTRNGHIGSSPIHSVDQEA